MNSPISEVGSCFQPHLNEALTSYCFEESSEAERDAVQRHLLECDVCWEEVRRLEGAVRALRSDPELAPPALTPELVGEFGLSGRVESRFGGHGRYVVSVALLYASLFAEGLVAEVSYAFDRHGLLAISLAPIVFVWVSFALISAFLMNVRMIRAARSSGLAWSAGTLGVGVAVLLAAILPLLPPEATIAATFQTRTIVAGYFKNVMYYFLPLALLLLMPSFHAVVTLQRELAQGRHRNGLGLLTGDRRAVAPPGMIFVRPWVFGSILVAAAFWALWTTHYLLDHLLPGPYMNLFGILLQMRVGLWFVIGVLCLVWYSRCLNELKRECLLVNALGEKA